MKSFAALFIATSFLVLTSSTFAQTKPAYELSLNAKCAIPAKPLIESWLKKKFKSDLEHIGIKKINVRVKLKELNSIDLVESVDLYKIFSSLNIIENKVICVKAPCPSLIELESPASEHIANIEQCLLKLGVDVIYSGVRQSDSVEGKSEKVSGKLSTELKVPGSLVPKTK